ncbi:MAG: hypothetical protein ACYTFT_12075 [Planctomycetota bacterium]|jgi:hypothetical protein
MRRLYRDTPSSRLLLLPLITATIALETQLGPLAAAIGLGPDLLVALLAAWAPGRRGTLTLAVVIGGLRALISGGSRAPVLLGYLLAGSALARLRPGRRPLPALDQGLVAGFAYLLVTLPFAVTCLGAGQPIGPLAARLALAALATAALTGLFTLPLTALEGGQVQEPSA